MTAVVWASQAMVAMAAPRPNLLLIAVMVATVSVLMAAHTCEIIVWSLAYGLVDAAPRKFGSLYFAFVNYTTWATATFFRVRLRAGSCARPAIPRP